MLLFTKAVRKEPDYAELNTKYVAFVEFMLLLLKTHLTNKILKNRLAASCKLECIFPVTTILKTKNPKYLARARPLLQEVCQLVKCLTRCLLPTTNILIRFQSSIIVNSRKLFVHSIILFDDIYDFSCSMTCLLYLSLSISACIFDAQTLQILLNQFSLFLIVYCGRLY